MRDVGCHKEDKYIEYHQKLTEVIMVSWEHVGLFTNRDSCAHVTLTEVREKDT